MQARISRLLRTAEADAVDLGGLLAKRAQNVQLGFRHGVRPGTWRSLMQAPGAKK